jgi:hypothetical protein
MPAKFVARNSSFVVYRAKGDQIQLHRLCVRFHRLYKLGFHFLFLTILRKGLCLHNLNVVEGEWCHFGSVFAMELVLAGEVGEN